MKKLGFILAASAIAFSFSIVRAEDEYTYSKLFEEGKVWNIVTEWFDFTTRESHTEYTQASFKTEWSDGENIFSQLNCFNQTTGSSFTDSYVEKDKIIYSKYIDTPPDYKLVRIIDYNLGCGDPVPVTWGGYPAIDEFSTDEDYVVIDEVIDIRGARRRILSIGSEKDGAPSNYWIEGIGSIDHWLMDQFEVPTCAPYVQSRRIASCYLNGECIFEYGDLEDYIAKNGVGSIEAETPETLKAEYYNLQGVRVSNPENGIFIVRQGSKTHKIVK